MLDEMKRANFINDQLIAKMNLQDWLRINRVDQLAFAKEAEISYRYLRNIVKGFMEPSLRVRTVISKLTGGQIGTDKVFFRPKEKIWAVIDEQEKVLSLWDRRIDAEKVCNRNESITYFYKNTFVETIITETEKEEN